MLDAVIAAFVKLSSYKGSELAGMTRTSRRGYRYPQATIMAHPSFPPF